MRSVKGTRGQRDRRLLLLMALALLATAGLQMPALLDEFAVDEDFRSFWWLSKIRDPALYPQDPFAGSTYVDVILFGREWPFYPSSPGYGLLCGLGSLLVSPTLFSKVLALVLMPATVWYVYRFGTIVRDRNAGTAMAVGFVVLNLASPTSLSVLAGLQRSFACTLVLALVYYVQVRRHDLAAVTLVASASIYAPMFALGAVAWGLHAWRVGWPLRIRRMVSEGGMRWLLAAALISVLVLSSTLVARTTYALTEEATADESSRSHRWPWEDPIYQAGGLRPLFLLFPIIGRGGLVNKSTDALHFSALIALACLILAIKGRRALDLPSPVWCVLWASLIGFALAWAAFLVTGSFALYLPSRYTRVGLFVFLTSTVFLNGRDAVREAVALVRGRRGALAWMVAAGELGVVALVATFASSQSTLYGFNLKWALGAAGIALGGVAVILARRRQQQESGPRAGSAIVGRALAAALVIVGLVGWAGYAYRVRQADVLNPPPAERELIAYLSTLPKDAPIGGSPCALDSVPLFAKRQVLFSCEWPIRDEGLMRAALSAYYSDDTGDIARLCQRNGVEYLVVDEATYTPEYIARGWLFFEPHNSELLAEVSGRERFALTAVPLELELFRSGDLFVVSCDALAE